MRLPRPRKTERQTELFDDRVQLTFAALRNWCGDFYEEATAVATGGARLKTDSRCEVCPDIQWFNKRRPTQNCFFEIKSVGKNGYAIVYESRFRKDVAWLAKNRCRSYYWFWKHQGSVQHSSDLTSLRQHLAHTTSSLIILEHSILEAILNRHPVTRLNSAAQIRSGPNLGKRLGYGNRSTGWGWGWKASMKELEAACTQTRIFGLPVQVYGCTIPIIRVSSGNRVAERFLL